MLLRKRYIQRRRIGLGGVSTSAIHSFSPITTINVTTTNAIGRRRVQRHSTAAAAASSTPPPSNEDQGHDHDSRTNRSAPPHYHPSEEIPENVTPMVEDTAAHLTDAEVCRTIVEMNGKATLIFSSAVDDEIFIDGALCPELSYSTNDHGDVYIEVNSEEDVLQNFTSNDNLMQVFIGMDNNIESLAEMEDDFSDHLSIDHMDEEDIDSDDDFEQDMVVISEDDEDDEIFDDWKNMETMHESHPMYFAMKIVEVVSDEKYNWMDPPSTGLAIQGFIRPVLAEENFIVRKRNLDSDHERTHSTEVSPKDRSKPEGLQSGTIFYKLEMINIQLVSTSYTNISLVKVEEYRKARPDIIAKSKAKIISRLKSGGVKTTEALKSLCWRAKGIQVEEVVLTGVDSLGFDLRACSGTLIQNLRFGFKRRATSEYSAERQLRDIIFF